MYIYIYIPYISGFLLVNLVFFGLGTILTTFWYEMEDFGETGPESETSGRDLAPGKGLGGRWADI